MKKSNDWLEPLQIERDSLHVTLNPRDPAFYNNPYPYYDVLRRQAPIFYWEAFGFWCFVAHEDVNTLLRDRRLGRQILHLTTRETLGWPPERPDLKPFYDVEAHSLLELEPPDHTRIRGLIQKAFMARQIERLRDRITVLSHQLIDEMMVGNEADLLTAFATPIPVFVIAELLGVPTSHSDDLLRWSHAMVSMYQLARTAEQEHAAVQASLEFVAFLRDFVQHRRQHPQDDLITQLISVEESGEKLTEAELITTCILLLNAGHEATVHVIGNGVRALLQNRAQWEAWPQDEKGVKTAVAELLRFDTPLHLFNRWVLSDDFTYKGHHFPFGTQVALLLGAANRDPAQFTDPHQLKIGRSPNPHLSFGGGIHYCIGAPLARLELQVALSILRQRLPNLQLRQEVAYNNSYHFHGLTHLPVKW